MKIKSRENLKTKGVKLTIWDAGSAFIHVGNLSATDPDVFIVTQSPRGTVLFTNLKTGKSQDLPATAVWVRVEAEVTWGLPNED